MDNGGVGVREFQGDDVGQVLRLLARQAKINMVVSEAVAGTVTMRLEDVTALQAIAIIVKSKGLFMDQIDNVYYIKTGAERTAEPTESDSYQFSYGRAKDIAPLLAASFRARKPPQVDERTNTIFYRETRSNIDNIRKLLVQIDQADQAGHDRSAPRRGERQSETKLRHQLGGRGRRSRPIRKSSNTAQSDRNERRLPGTVDSRTDDFVLGNAAN